MVTWSVNCAELRTFTELQIIFSLYLKAQTLVFQIHSKHVDAVPAMDGQCKYSNNYIIIIMYSIHNYNNIVIVF